MNVKWNTGHFCASLPIFMHFLHLLAHLLPLRYCLMFAHNYTYIKQTKKSHKSKQKKIFKQQQFWAKITTEWNKMLTFVYIFCNSLYATWVYKKLSLSIIIIIIVVILLYISSFLVYAILKRRVCVCKCVQKNTTTTKMFYFLYSTKMHSCV